MSASALPRCPAIRKPAVVAEVPPPPLGIRFGATPDSTGRPVGFDPEAGQHLLVTGAAGTGKSSVFRVLMDGALTAGHDVYLTTAAAGHDRYASVQDHLAGAGTALPGAQRVLKMAVAEMDRRQEQMVEQNKRRYDLLMPPTTPVLIVVDGILELLKMDLEIGSTANMRRAAVGSMLDAIAQHGPKAGLSLLLTARDADALPAPRLFPHLHDLADTAVRLDLSATSRGTFTAADGEPVEVRTDRHTERADRTTARTG